MKFDETTIRILVRKNYGECFDFYTEKIGLVPVWGDRNGPYTSFAINSGTLLASRFFRRSDADVSGVYAASQQRTA